MALWPEPTAPTLPPVQVQVNEYYYYCYSHDYEERLSPTSDNTTARKRMLWALLIRDTKQGYGGLTEYRVAQHYKRAASMHGLATTCCNFEWTCGGPR